MANFCSKCGNPLDPGARFCDKCGTPVQISPSVQPQAIEAVPGTVDPAGKKAGSGRIVISTIAVIVLWLVQIVLLRKGIENPVTKVLNFVTFAKGSMNRGIAGYLGGTLGMGVVASALVTVFGGGLKTVGNGFKRMFSGRSGYGAYGEANGAKGSFGFAVLGVIGALLLYFVYTGSLGPSGMAAGAAGILVSARALGSRSGGLYRFVSRFTSRKTNGEKIKSPGAAGSLLSGATIGFALAMAVSGLSGVAGIDGSRFSFESFLSGAGLGSGQKDETPTEVEEFANEEAPEETTGDTADANAAETFALLQENDAAEADNTETVNAETDTAEADIAGTADQNALYDQGLGGYTPADYAISGGTWETLQSGEKIYTAVDGSSVMNVWVEDGGKYYYIDYSGCLMKNNYSQDGFWAGEDGSWYESVPQRTEDPEPQNGLSYGTDPKFTVEVLDYSDGSHYGIATRSYSFGYTEKFNVIPLGHGTYLLEGEDDFNSGMLMSVSDDRKTLIVSGGGITEDYSIDD